MKVLGESKIEVIVSMSKDELAKLAGYHSAYSLQEVGKTISPGLEMPIGNIFDKAMDTLNFYRESYEQFNKTQKAIGKLLEFITPKGIKS
jgi:hypothetical protein